jgi:hypothetical protein
VSHPAEHAQHSKQSGHGGVLLQLDPRHPQLFHMCNGLLYVLQETECTEPEASISMQQLEVSWHIFVDPVLGDSCPSAQRQPF